MRSWRKSGLVAAGAITSGILLTYDVRATEWLVAQTPTQPQLSQPSELERATGLEQPSGLILPQPNPRPRIRRTRDRNQENRNQENRNPGNRRPNRTDRERRIPIEPVPFPEQRPRRPQFQQPQQQGIPRVPSTSNAPLTGISGQIVIAPICSVTAPARDCTPRPYQGSIKVMPITRSNIFRIVTDDQGQFQARLQPGVYIVQPDSADFPAGTSQTVTVVEGMVRSMRFDFPGYRPATAQAPGQTARTLQQINEQSLNQPGRQTQQQAAPQVLPNGFLRF